MEQEIFYPPGCKEVMNNMRVDKLIRRLKLLSAHFQGLDQQTEDTDYDEYVPLCLHLVEDGFLNHESKDVRLQIACCISDILRIYAPQAPYQNPEQLKIIFKFLTKQLKGLKNVIDPAYKGYFYLLENLVAVKSFQICLELEDAEELIADIFETIFCIIHDDHSPKLKLLVMEVLYQLLFGWDHLVSEKLISIILQKLAKKSVNVGAYKLARDLIIKSSELLEFGVANYFDKILIYGPKETETVLNRKNQHSNVFDVIYELHNICPRLTASVIPQLEFTLKSSDESERMGTVALLGKMFSEKSSFLASLHPQLWKAFLGRFNDVCSTIRTKCVQYSLHFLLHHPDLRKDIVETLKLRQHDGEENVRFEVVKAIVATAKLNFEIVSESEELLNYVIGRIFDKKFKIRKEALQGLALIYKTHLTLEVVPVATRQAMSCIKEKILHGYYLTSLDDKILVARLFFSCLVPYQMNSHDRMMKLLYLYVHLDTSASRAFVEIQKMNMLVRRCVNEFLDCIRTHKDKDDYEQYLNIRISQLTKFLPDRVKAAKFLIKFAEHLGEDEDSFNTMKLIVDSETDCKSCANNINTVLKKLGPPIVTNLYHTTIKIVLEKASSVMVDKEAITKLLLIIFDVIGGKQEVLNALSCSQQRGISRGISLISVLSSILPAHFINKESLNLLMQMLNIVDRDLQPQILIALTYIGRYKAIGTHDQLLMKTLVRRCKEMLLTGTPKQAKHAVRCMYVNLTESRTQTFSGVIDALNGRLDFGNSRFRSSIVALGYIALLMPQEFKSELKTIISQKIVKELLMNPVRTKKDKHRNIRDWCEEEDLPEITQCMIAGLKATVRWLIGLKDNVRAACNTFNMLIAFVETGGEIVNTTESFSNAEKSWLRLAAGCYMLKICEHKGVGDQFTVNQFLSLCKLMNDEVPQVRSRFAMKLHLGLSRGIPESCLPLDFLGFYSLAGYEKDKKKKTILKEYVMSDVNKRREYIKMFLCTATDKTAEQMPQVMPDYMLAYGVSVLAHNPKFTSHEDTNQLAEVKECVWFIMEPLIIKSDLYSFGFYKNLLEGIKNHKNAIDPDDDEVNHRMYAVCDIALALLVQRSTTFEMQDYGLKPCIPRLYFTRHGGPSYPNRFLPSPSGEQIIPIVAENYSDLIRRNETTVPIENKSKNVSESLKEEEIFELEPSPSTSKRSIVKVIEIDDSQAISTDSQSQPKSNKILFKYPRKDQGNSSEIVIGVDDVGNLRPPMWLNDIIIDFWCKYIYLETWDRNYQRKSHIFSSFFYEAVFQALKKVSKEDEINPFTTFSELISGWTRNVNIFEKDFIFIPVNDCAHWVLVVICFPGLVANAETKEQKITVQEKYTPKIKRRRYVLNYEDDDSNSASETEAEEQHPCILILDSLRDTGDKTRSRSFRILRTFLQNEWNLKNENTVAFTENTMPGYFLDVPQQPNYSDCGVYVLKFFEMFFLKPILSYKEPLPDKTNWFSSAEAESLRSNFYEGILKYMKKHCPERLHLVPQIHFPESLDHCYLP